MEVRVATCTMKWPSTLVRLASPSRLAPFDEYRMFPAIAPQNHQHAQGNAGERCTHTSHIL
jgi:hypothetical protein